MGHHYASIISGANEAYVLDMVERRRSENFKALFGCKDFIETRGLFLIWCKDSIDMAISEVVGVVEMIESHLAGVCNALYHV